MSDDYYSPDAVDRWLRQWDLLCSLAETPATSRHHLDSDHHKDGPCLDSIRSGSGGRIPDALSWADVRADLQRAYAQLAIGSIERQVVWERMHRPASLDNIALRMRSRASWEHEGQPQSRRLSSSWPATPDTRNSTETSRSRARWPLNALPGSIQRRGGSGGGWIRDGRITLPRSITGDLVFCRFICVERWRAGRAGDTDRG